MELWCLKKVSSKLGDQIYHANQQQTQKQLFDSFILSEKAYLPLCTFSVNCEKGFGLSADKHASKMANRIPAAFNVALICVASDDQLLHADRGGRY